MSTKKSFVRGAAILSLAGLLGKVIGMFYKIWLIGLITEEGYAFYQSPYAVYQFLLVISSAGLPTAISKMVSEQIAKGNEASARTILKKTRLILFGTGISASIIMAALAQPIANMIGDPQAAPGFIALAPAIFFVCLMSAYRGYFQGMQNMTPTAISQVVEQVGKVTLGFGLAIAMRQHGLIWGAVGAIIGVTISEFLGFAYIYVRYLLHNKKNGAISRDLQPAPVDRFYSRLFSIAIPVTIGASTMSIVSLVDTALIQNRLLDIGYAISQARSMYSVITGMVTPIVNLPAVITLSISMALVPVMADCMVSGDRENLRRSASTGIKLAFLIGSAAAVGMGLLSENIITLLFKNSVSATSLAQGGHILSIMSVAVFFLSIMQVTTGMLQGLGKPFYPVFTLFAGIVAKIVLNYVLIGIPSLNIAGAAFATLACYGIAAIGNLYFVIRITGIKLSLSQFFIRPALAAGGMALCVFLLKRFLLESLGNSLTTILAVGIGVAVYAALMLLLGCLNRSDLAFVPGGRHIARLLNKLHIRI